MDRTPLRITDFLNSWRSWAKGMVLAASACVSFFSPSRLSCHVYSAPKSWQAWERIFTAILSMISACFSLIQSNKDFSCDFNTYIYITYYCIYDSCFIKQNWFLCSNSQDQESRYFYLTLTPSSRKSPPGKKKLIKPNYFSTSLTSFLKFPVWNHMKVGKKNLLFSIQVWGGQGQVVQWHTAASKSCFPPLLLLEKQL